MRISYECSELIAELEQDILEFGGDTKLVVWVKTLSNGFKLYTNYDFEGEESELEACGHFEKMKAKTLLNLLKRQNKVL